VVAAVVVAGCANSRAVSYDDAVAVTAPTIVPRPPSPGESPHLAALTMRDTAGLALDTANADAALLPDAVAAARAAVPEGDRLTGLAVRGENVYVSLARTNQPDREQLVLVSEGRLFVNDPTFSEARTFAFEDVDLSVPAQLVAGITARFPAVRVPDIVLNWSQSYDLGLVWNVEVEDARGTLATVFADLDGTVIAVDGS
jgi:hypothetical protein